MKKLIETTIAAEYLSEKLKMQLNEIIDLLEDVPCAEPEQVIQGQWEPDEEDDELYYCSNCHCEDALDYDEYKCRGKIRSNHSKFCPNCGAKMK